MELENNQSIEGKMDMPLDVDWYSFSLDADRNMTIDITNQSIHADLVGT